MAFAARTFTSCIFNGFKSLNVNGAHKFHVMVQPLPRLIIGAQTSSQNQVVSNVLSPMSVITGLQRLLVPVSSMINQISGFKVKGRLRRRCKDCYFVVRQQRLHVICPTHPRHKQMAMKKRDYKSWILTHATQSKIRPY